MENLELFEIDDLELFAGVEDTMLEYCDEAFMETISPASHTSCEVDATELPNSATSASNDDKESRKGGRGPRKDGKRRYKDSKKAPNNDGKACKRRTLTHNEIEFTIEDFVKCCKDTVSTMALDKVLSEVYGDILNKTYMDTLSFYEMYDLFSGITTRMASGTCAKDEFWKFVYELTKDKTRMEKVQDTLHVTKDFASWFLLHLKESLLRHLNSSEEKVSQRSRSFKKGENEVVAYIGGFIIGKLRGKSKSVIQRCTVAQPRARAERQLDILRALEGDAEHSFSAELVSLLNRGGLVYPKAGFVKILLDVDRLFRQYVSNKKTDIASGSIVAQCLGSTNISSKFKELVLEIKESDDFKMKQLETVLNLYVKIRCHSHAKNLAQKYKLQSFSKKSKKPSKKSLRAELKTSVKS